MVYMQCNGHTSLPHRSRIKPWAPFSLLVGLLLGLWLLGCSPFQRAATSPPAATPAVKPSPAAAATWPAATQELPPIRPEAETVTLTLWLPEHLAPGSKTDASRILEGQYEAFMAEYPNVVISYRLKKAYGKGGLKHFLVSTGAVAPQALPDLVALDVSELLELADSGLVQPLGGLLPDELFNDLFPFARQAVIHDGDLLGVFFQADLEHAIYNTDKIAIPPRTWADLFVISDISYSFPTSGQEGQVNDAFLIQYLALGGRLVDEGGKPTLDQVKLERTLRFYQQAHDKKVIPPGLARAKDLRDSWWNYALGQVSLAQVSTAQYLAEGRELSHTSFCSVPTQDGKTATLARGWAYAIVTKGGAKQSAAARFMEWILKPENLAEWATSSHRLPTSRAAVNRLKVSPNYVAFLRGQLGAAYPPPPSGPSFAKQAKILQKAVDDVLRGTSTPEAAARWAISQME